MRIAIQKTDSRGRLTLPLDFASCFVSVKRHGDELRVRKVVARRYSFKELIAKVTKKNIHTEVKTGPVLGKETL